jgi:hypothetical protein
MPGLSDQKFWPSYVDLMTSLFFVVFVLFIVSYRLYTKNIEEVKIKNEEIKVKAYEADKLEEIRKTISQLMNDTTLFIYEKENKRYRLALNIQFKRGKYNIVPYEVENYNETYPQIIKMGKELKIVFDSLIQKKNNDLKYKNISYLLVISGRASRDNYTMNYELSYNRALSLYKFWKSNDIVDIDSEIYQQIIDLQISGIGTGGIGRYSENEEERNRGFFIQILPKIGEFN